MSQETKQQSWQNGAQVLWEVPEELGLFRVKKRSFRGDLIMLYLKAVGGEVRVCLFSHITVVGREVMALSHTRRGSVEYQEKLLHRGL